MPYTKGASNVSGVPYAGPGSTATNQQANNWETQYDEATNSFEQDLLTAFVLSGGVGTIHGGLPKQMDVTTCIFFPLQTDGTLRRRVVTATNFTTVTASTTYFLDYNPDGTTSWGTAHSGSANYLPIASVTTDGSGNILVITDARTLNTTLLGGMAGSLLLTAPHLSKIYSDGGAITSDGAGNLSLSGKLTVAGPLTLAAGNQETGKMGNRVYIGTGTSTYIVTNFKATMTNTPSSITAGTPDFSENFSSLTAAFISKTGFALSWIASGGGFVMSSWIGPYTTVGNCVRAVDANARTFTHHCDQCGLTREGLNIEHDVLLVPELGSDGQYKTLTDSRPGAYGMSVKCPCGATEMLTTSLTSEDAALTDPSPDGLTTVGELARQVRALQAALSLPMAQ